MQMKKFINDPDNLTAELLEGLALANPDILELGEDNMVINKKLAEADRVTIVTQGGSGHEPAIEGFVGEGMVDIDVVGDIFAAPGPQACVDAIKLADKGKGVLYIVLNHAGDMLTGNMTMKQCKKQGLNVVKVVTQEDVSNAPRENADDRRGLVGCIPTYKIAGAAAAEGMSLEEVAAVAQRFADNMATLAVVQRFADNHGNPGRGRARRDASADGHASGRARRRRDGNRHGGARRGGRGRQPMKSADETAAIMVNALVKDIGIEPGEKVMLIINGSGATTLMEQLIVYRAAVNELAKQDIEVVANFVGEMLTVQEQAGFQMFMARMDDELLRLWNAPCTTPYLKK
nr:dihydroxyacetone kinase subunit DhaK [Eggerthella sinensis]